MAELPIAGQIARLFEREARDREPPLGKALDVGCGTGIWSVELAWRGWTVTGVEPVGKAVRAARRRVRESGASARILQGDATRLRGSDVGHGYQLVLDFGVLHGLTPEERLIAAHEITSVVEPRATLLLLAWEPAHRGLLPAGMSRDEIRTLFGAWDLIDEEAADTSGAAAYVRKASPRFYRLRKA